MAKFKEVFTITVKSDDDGVFVVDWNGDKHRPARQDLRFVVGVAQKYINAAAELAFKAWLEKRKQAMEKARQDAKS